MVNWLRDFMNERGKFLDTPESLTTIKEWLNNKEVNISQYEIPQGGFACYNDFFMRQIKKSLRPIDPALYTIVSPSDGYVWLQETNITLQ